MAEVLIFRERRPRSKKNYTAVACLSQNIILRMQRPSHWERSDLLQTLRNVSLQAMKMLIFNHNILMGKIKRFLAHCRRALRELGIYCYYFFFFIIFTTPLPLPRKTIITIFETSFFILPTSRPPFSSPEQKIIIINR